MGTPHFRAGVVMVVQRSDGHVLAFERADSPGAWQLPQGGLDVGETPTAAAWRELAEETGLDASHVELVAELPGWTVYELPDDARRARPARLGQAHRWFVFRALSDDVVPATDGREFVDHRWTSVDELIAEVVEFRRTAYQRAFWYLRRRS